MRAAADHGTDGWAFRVGSLTCLVASPTISTSLVMASRKAVIAEVGAQIARPLGRGSDDVRETSRTGPEGPVLVGCAA